MQTLQANSFDESQFDVGYLNRESISKHAKYDKKIKVVSCKHVIFNNNMCIFAQFCTVLD